MSLLSSTQGTPERVWSLLRLLAAHEGTLGREDITGWLSPPFVQGKSRREITGEPDGQAIGAATSLGFVKREALSYSLSSSAAANYPEFADQVHAHLRTIDKDDPDYVVLETFAWVVAEIENRQSTAWVGSSPQEFADAVEHAIGADDSSGERRFNSTKIAPWRRWILFLGLGSDFPTSIGFYPYVADRLARELFASNLPREVELPAADVLAEISQKMPYLDDGVLFVQMATRANVRLPDRRLSRLLSAALRDLNDDGLISLLLTGDASDLFALAPDGQHPIQTLQTIKLRELPQ